MTKDEALKMAYDWLNEYAPPEVVQACKEALALSEKQHTFPDKKQSEQEVKCNPHPKAPHGFSRDASHSADRYVCDCEGWDAWQDGYEEGLRKGLELEQPAQEPVAWAKFDDDGGGEMTHMEPTDGSGCDFDFKGWTPLYTHPAPSWQGLCDDEKLAIIRKWKDARTMREQELIGLGDAFEQALKEKNT